MVTDELRRYVAENLDLGHHPDDIAQGLIDQGWSESDINHVFDEFFPPETKELSSLFQFDTNNKTFLLLVLGGLTAAVVSVAFGVYVIFSNPNSESQQTETVVEDQDGGTTDADLAKAEDLIDQVRKINELSENHGIDRELTDEEKMATDEIEKQIIDTLLIKESLEQQSRGGVLVINSNKQLVGEDNKIVIDSVTLPSPGFIKINSYASGVSDLLPAGTSEDVEIVLDRQPNSGSLRAVVYLDSNGDGIPQLDNRQDLLLTGSNGLSINGEVKVVVELPGTLGVLNHLLLTKEEVGGCYISSSLTSATIDTFFSRQEDLKEYLNIEAEAFSIDWSERNRRGENPYANFTPVKTMYISHNNGTVYTELVCLEDPIDEGMARFDELIAEIEGG